MELTDLEHAVLGEIEKRRDDLVDLACALIRFDTTTRQGTDSPPRDEAALQHYLASRLVAAGAEVEVWEPDPDDVLGSRQVPAGLAFHGFPQLVARFVGRGGGQSLMLNGHIDVVSAEPLEAWTSGPTSPDVREGRLYGRGACDMKGGVAAMVIAAEAVAAADPGLGGDVLICTTTDEESTSAGGVATVAHGVSADAAVVTEPTSLQVGVACRGSLLPTVTVHGRPGHAGGVQPHWREGGAVNAVEKMAVVIEAVQRLREEWSGDPRFRHGYLPAGDVVCTLVHGGEWEVSHAASCWLRCHLTYLPGQADRDGFGTKVEAEFTRAILRMAAADSWLAEHPPEITWGVDVPPAEIAPDHPVVKAMLGSMTALGRPVRRFGTDYWNDGATFTRAGTPSVTFGPGSVTAAHTVDEHVELDELLGCAQGLALTVLRFCAQREQQERSGDDA